MPKYEKGKSGNPHGRPKLPDELKKAKSLSQKEFTKILTTELYESGSLEKMVRKLIEMACEGNLGAVSLVLDRVIGKVQEKIKHDGLRNPVIIYRKNGDQVEMGYQEDEDDDETV